MNFIDTKQSTFNYLRQNDYNSILESLYIQNIQEENEQQRILSEQEGQRKQLLFIEKQYNESVKERNESLKDIMNELNEFELNYPINRRIKFADEIGKPIKTIRKISKVIKKPDKKSSINKKYSENNPTNKSLLLLSRIENTLISNPNYNIKIKDIKKNNIKFLLGYDNTENYGKNTNYFEPYDEYNKLLIILVKKLYIYYENRKLNNLNDLLIELKQSNVDLLFKQLFKIKFHDEELFMNTWFIVNGFYKKNTNTFSLLVNFKIDLKNNSEGDYFYTNGPFSNIENTEYYEENKDRFLHWFTVSDDKFMNDTYIDYNNYNNNINENNKKEKESLFINEFEIGWKEEQQEEDEELEYQMDESEYQMDESEYQIDEYEYQENESEYQENESVDREDKTEYKEDEYSFKDYLQLVIENESKYKLFIEDIDGNDLPTATFKIYYSNIDTSTGDLTINSSDYFIADSEYKDLLIFLYRKVIIDMNEIKLAYLLYETRKVGLEETFKKFFQINVNDQALFMSSTIHINIEEEEEYDNNNNEFNLNKINLSFNFSIRILKNLIYTNGPYSIIENSDYYLNNKEELLKQLK